MAEAAAMEVREDCNTDGDVLGDGVVVLRAMPVAVSVAVWRPRRRWSPSSAPRVRFCRRAHELCHLEHVPYRHLHSRDCVLHSQSLPEQQ